MESASRPMPLGLARDDPLAGAPALNAHFKEGERASSSNGQGAVGAPGWSLLSAQKLLSLLPQAVHLKGD